MRRSSFGGAVLLQSSTDDSGRFDASPPRSDSRSDYPKRLPEATSLTTPNVLDVNWARDALHHRELRVLRRGLGSWQSGLDRRDNGLVDGLNRLGQWDDGAGEELARGREPRRNLRLRVRAKELPQVKVAAAAIPGAYAHCSTVRSQTLT